MAYYIATATPNSNATLTTASNWREREQARFARGKYKPVPWAKEGWFADLPADDPRRDHFVHVSERDPWMLAYTPKPGDGEADRRVPIKPGRYLQKFFSDRLSAEQIKHFASQVRGSGLKITFTDNPGLIKKVYQSTGVACMSRGTTHYRAAHFNGGVHPTAAYCGGDLKLAYATDPKSGEIIARAIAWPERKVFSRCYGDYEAMKKALEADGYTYGLLDGARLALIPLQSHSDHFTAPYVDHIKWARHDPEAPALILQARATGATHSVQHGDGIAYPIASAPPRPAGNSSITIAEEWKRLCAHESGQRKAESEQSNTGELGVPAWYYQTRIVATLDFARGARAALNEVEGQAAMQQAQNAIGRILV